MRKVTFICANSLDNYIARPDHRVDWLKWSRDTTKIMAEFWKTIDTVVMSRQTYDVAKSQGGGAYYDMKNYVCSRSLPPKKGKEIEFVRDAVKLIRKLKKAKGKGICIMSGGKLANALFEAKLIDEVGVNIHPVLLGNGIPLFHPLKKQIDMQLIESKTLKHGCIFALYRVKK